MLIYIVIYLTLLMLCLADKSRSKNVKVLALGTSFVILLLIIGTRDETGTDWLPYWEHYNASKNNVFQNFSFEPGYQAFVNAGNAVGLSYAQFLFLFTFAYLSIFYRAFWFFKYPNTIVFLFYSTYIIGIMGTSRQLIALSICCLALTKLLQGKNPLFFLLIIIAATFHMSSFILILAIFVPILMKNNLRPKNSSYAILLIFITIFIFVDINSIISAIAPLGFVYEKLQAYAVTDAQTPIYFVDDPWLVGLLYAKRASLALFFFYESRKENYNNSYYAIAMIYILGFGIFCIVYPILPAVAVRSAIYFSILDIVFLSYFAWNSNWKSWAIIVVIIFSVQGMISSLTYDSDLTVPYKGLFLNSDLYRLLR